MKLIDPQGRAFVRGLIGEVPTGNVLWVDIVNGNDVLAVRERMTVPFQSLPAAKDAAQSGDTIIVLPGDYTTDENLFRAGVNWHFLTGAKVTGSATIAALFEIGEASTTRITGEGEFVAKDGANPGANYVLSVMDDDADVIFKAQRMLGYGAAVHVDYLAETAKVIVECGELDSDYGSTIDVRGGTVSVFAKVITIQTDYGVVYTEGGKLRIHAGRIASAGDDSSEGHSLGLLCLGPAELDVEAGEIRTGGVSVYLGATNGVITIRNARIESFYDSPVFVLSGSASNPPNLRLWNCFLKSGSSTSIGSYGQTPLYVGFYGQNCANMAIDSGLDMSVVGLEPTVADLA